MAAEGNAIARVNDMVLFIPYGAPGDVADIKIDRKKRSYAEGHIERLTKPSELRTEPQCKHFGTCGGCRWQHLPYEYQLKAKQQQVVDALTRIAKVALPKISPIIGSERIWEYRNKMEYTFSNKRWITWEQLRSGEDVGDRSGAGFHIPVHSTKCSILRNATCRTISQTESACTLRTTASPTGCHSTTWSSAGFSPYVDDPHADHRRTDGSRCVRRR